MKLFALLLALAPFAALAAESTTKETVRSITIPADIAAAMECQWDRTKGLVCTFNQDVNPADIIIEKR
jgi:hypothetical protein